MMVSAIQSFSFGVIQNVEERKAFIWGFLVSSIITLAFTSLSAGIAVIVASYLFTYLKRGKLAARRILFYAIPLIVISTFFLVLAITAKFVS